MLESAGYIFATVASGRPGRRPPPNSGPGTPGAGAGRQPGALPPAQPTGRTRGTRHCRRPSGPGRAPPARNRTPAPCNPRFAVRRAGSRAGRPAGPGARGPPCRRRQAGVRRRSAARPLQAPAGSHGDAAGQFLPAQGEQLRAGGLLADPRPPAPAPRTPRRGFPARTSRTRDIALRQPPSGVAAAYCQLFIQPIMSRRPPGTLLKDTAA